ncbi:MAG: UDP-3-O-(3-hydroxymyristoyl)glucosamine N-acyltransferase [Candidatus Methylacidiphilales bacterium]|nr:UDP-3-O-(3-hydroxymyristoyl)glucosamine N-acyltransferase [Candidatus Methylacidiphilales bacterium]
MSRSLADIAALVGGELVGDGSITCTGINDLGRASGTQVSFLGNSRYTKAALATQAAAVLVPRDFNQSLPCATIRVDNPTAAFAAVIALFAPPEVTWSPGIHPTAVIGPGVQLGSDLYIGPHVTLEAGCRIGDRVHLGPGVYVGHEARIGDDSFLHASSVVRERCVLGKRVILHAGAVIGSDGFGYEFHGGKYVKIPQVGYVQIDDDCEIGANTTIDRGRFDKTWIQEGCKIDNLVMIAHNVVIGKHSIIVAQVGISGSSSLGAYNTVAGQSALVGHVKTTDKVTITAWTAVTKDITEPGVYRGGPAKPMRESMEIEALTHRLPELVKRLRDLEKEVSVLKGLPG